MGSGAAVAGPIDGPVAVVGMGKLGGNELNYASDVDVVLVAEDPDAADRPLRAAVDARAALHRVDLDLRPEGRDGALVRTVVGYANHWARWARGVGAAGVAQGPPGGRRRRRSARRGPRPAPRPCGADRSPPRTSAPCGR